MGHAVVFAPGDSVFHGGIQGTLCLCFLEGGLDCPAEQGSDGDGTIWTSDQRQTTPCGFPPEAIHPGSSKTQRVRRQNSPQAETKSPGRRSSKRSASGTSEEQSCLQYIRKFFPQSATRIHRVDH